MALRWPAKDPDETLDYSVDWSRWLQNGRTISAVTWSFEDENGVKVPVLDSDTVNGLTRVSATNTPTVATIYLSAGTNNATYRVFCGITDSNGMTTERSIYLNIKEN